MPFRRFEIILPIRYNDGTPIEQAKYWDTAEEIIARFGAMTWQPEILHGIWVHEGSRYEEDNVKFIMDVDDTSENRAFFASLKPRLKERFRQIDIWIVSHVIDIT